MSYDEMELDMIDRCLPLVYQKYFADPKPENMPVLGDLYDCLRKQKEPQAQRIATALEIYVNGSLKVFNHRTNVELNNRIVCFDIKELGKQLKKIGMLIVQDQVWNRVTINRGIKSTRYYIDEFHLLLKEEQTAAYSVEIWKRFRKWGGVPTGITQNIKDLLASREIENIFENSDFILMLNQAAGDRQILAKQLNISPYQLSYVTNSGEGEGLLFYGTTIIPFKDKFDKTLKFCINVPRSICTTISSRRLWNKEIWKGACNNMASIRERNGKFNVIYSYTNEKGERKQKWETYETKAEAKRRKKEIEYKKEMGSFVVRKCKTLDELITEYVALYGKENWALSTYEGNVSLINNYILPIIGDAKLSEINTRFIERYYQSLLKRRAVINPLNKTSRNEFVSSSTVRDVNKLLRNCFEQAVKWELMEKNPCTHATVPKHKSQKRDIWTADTLMYGTRD